MRDDAAVSTLHHHRPLLHALAYRMLGSATEAEEVVQDTFVRALASPPDPARPIRPWLVRVTCNLARDRLRRRRTRAYHGPWLPEPLRSPPEDPSADPETRLRLAQTATLAWLTAAEALTPEQRAVVLLRDVLDWDVDEVCGVLDRTPGAVRSLPLRARRALADAPVPDATPESLQAHHKALQALLVALVARDEAALHRLLAEDVVIRSDGGGEVHAIGKVLVGRERVAHVVLAIAVASGQVTTAEIVEVNGLPAFIARSEPHPMPRWPTRSLLSPVLGADGRIVALLNIVAPTKLAALQERP